MLYDHWRKVVRDYGPRLALQELQTGRSWTFDNLAAAADALPPSESKLCFPTGNDAGFVLEMLRGWRGGLPVCPLEAGQQPPPAANGNFPVQIAHLKLTSATTGQARLVIFSAEQVMADADNIVRTMGLHPGSANVGVISLAHSYGFSNLITPLLLHGIPLVLPGSPLPEVLRESLRTLKEVTLPAVPAMWRTWHDARIPFANVRLGISAGAPLPLPLENDVFERSALKLHNFYGATECGGIAYDRTSQPRTHASLIGTALDGVELTTGMDGCVKVHSRAVGEGYWPEAAMELSEGCFQTSDLADISAAGVFLRGRRTDQINVAGRKLSPERVEDVLRLHPAVQECVVFGVPSEDLERAEEVVACVLVRAPATAEELRQYLLSRLEGWQLPRAWWFVPSLDANSRGKISRNALRQEYLSCTRASNNTSSVVKQDSGTPH